MGKIKFSNIYIDKKLYIEKNNSIVRISPYIKYNERILWKCLTSGCNHEWSAFPNNIFKKKNPTGCPKCAGLIKLTNEEIDRRLKIDNIKIKRVGEAIKCINYIYWECEVCKLNWETSPNSILNVRSGCPQCNKNLKLTNEEIDRRLIENKRLIKRIENIVSAKIKIKWKCHISTCNYIWEATPNNILYNNGGCPRCNFSKGNLELEKICSSMGISYKTEYRFSDCKYKYPLPFDLYLPDFNYCIEYQGEHHYDKRYWKHFRLTEKECEEKFQERLKRDAIKKDFCEKNNIKLIVIHYKEFKNIKIILEKELKL